MIAAALPLPLLMQAAAPAPCASERIERARVHSGIFVDGFEDQRFVEGAQTVADAKRPAVASTWISIDPVGQASHLGITRRVPGRAYRIRFVGSMRTREKPCGYGHFGMFNSDVHVDRVLAMTPLSSDSPR